VTVCIGPVEGTFKKTALYNVELEVLTAKLLKIQIFFGCEYKGKMIIRNAAKYLLMRHNIPDLDILLPTVCLQRILFNIAFHL
jgi:hypothetical protein